MKNFAFVTKDFDKKIRKSFSILYGEFIDSFNSFCNNQVEVIDAESVDKALESQKIRSLTRPNKSWVVCNCPAYFDVTDYVYEIVPNISSGVKIALLQTIIEFGGTVVINGYRFNKEHLINYDIYKEKLTTK